MTLQQQIKRRLKPIYFGVKRLAAQTFYSYSPSDLAAALEALGIVPGDTLLVHSGFNRYSGFTGAPGDVIDLLLQTVGEQGHILMMSMPYSGSSERYVASDPVFNVLRTPSAVGLISEAFRRRSGVVRSCNPLHPILVYGSLAQWLAADHEHAAYSCGKGSPFARFLSLEGKLLFFDAPYGSMTFMHYVEDLFQDQLPVSLYDPAPVSLRLVDATGNERVVPQYFFSQAARERRHFAPIEDALTHQGSMQTAKIGNSELLCVAARDVVSSARELVENGTGFYR